MKWSKPGNAVWNAPCGMAGHWCFLAVIWYYRRRYRMQIDLECSGSRTREIYWRNCAEVLETSDSHPWSCASVTGCKYLVKLYGA